MLTRAALPVMLERGGGSIVLVASVNGMAAAPASAAYDVSKAGLIALARAIAVDYGARGIRANALCPGWVITPMGDGAMDELGASKGIGRQEAYDLATADVPLRRAGSAEEMAACCLFLASDESSIVTGTSLVADGGGLAVELTSSASVTRATATTASATDCTRYETKSTRSRRKWSAAYAPNGAISPAGTSCTAEMKPRSPGLLGSSRTPGSRSSSRTRSCCTRGRPAGSAASSVSRTTSPTMRMRSFTGRPYGDEEPASSCPSVLSSGRARSAGSGGGVQAHGAGHALELDRADLPEGDLRPARGVDHLLADEHLARSGVVGDPRGDVHRLAVVVALLEDHRPGVQADVRRRQPGLGHARHHLEGGHDARAGVREVEHDPVAQPLDRPAAVLDRRALHQPAELLASSAAAASPRSWVRRV